MSPYIGRRFSEVKDELEDNGENYSWEITRASSRVFKIDENDLYVLRDIVSPLGERKLVLAYLCKADTKGGVKNGL